MSGDKDDQRRAAAKSGGDHARPKMALPRATIINGRTYILATEEESANFKKLIEQEGGEEDPRTWSNVDVAKYIASLLEDIDSQNEFVEQLRGLHNDITDLFVNLLEPKGHLGWKLILKRTKRGSPSKKPPDW